MLYRKGRTSTKRQRRVPPLQERKKDTPGGPVCLARFSAGAKLDNPITATPLTPCAVESSCLTICIHTRRAYRCHAMPATWGASKQSACLPTNCTPTKYAPLPRAEISQQPDPRRGQPLASRPCMHHQQAHPMTSSTLACSACRQASLASRKPGRPSSKCKALRLHAGRLYTGGLG